MNESSRRLRSFALGVAAGGVTSLVAVVAYVVSPLTAAAYVYGLDGTEATFAVLEHFFGQAPLVHAAILLGTPFVTTACALWLARRWDLRGDAFVVAGVVATPVVTVWMAMVVAVAAIGVTNSVAFVPFALLFGVPITVVLTVVVGGLGLVGTAGSYALVRWLDRDPG